MLEAGTGIWKRKAVQRESPIFFFVCLVSPRMGGAAWALPTSKMPADHLLMDIPEQGDGCASVAGAL